MKTCRGFLLSLLLAGVAMTLGADETRTLRVRQDDGQTRFATKLYELKNAQAGAIAPYLRSAALRYNRNSTVKVVSERDGEKQAILVSTGRDMIPYLDEIVKVLDASDAKLEGTGVVRIAYQPKFRAPKELATLLNAIVASPAGKVYVNPENNTIYWVDQKQAAENTLAWVGRLDRPLPQINLRLNYYEVRDSKLNDSGFDYLAWKNGPGVNLLNVGYNVGEIAWDELLSAATAIGSSSWDFGGFFTAPQFDMSFIRLLQQDGNANMIATANISMVNTPVAGNESYARLLQFQMEHANIAPFIYRASVYPEYQNIAKNVLGRSFVGKSFYEDEEGVKHANPPVLDVAVINPFICGPGSEVPEGQPAENAAKLPPAGGVIFSFALNYKNVVERGNTGNELSNSVFTSGEAAVPFGREQILSVYEKENEVEQTIGIQLFDRMPYIKYLFSTVTKMKERTYIIITAEALPATPDGVTTAIDPESVSTQVDVFEQKEFNYYE